MAAYDYAFVFERLQQNGARGDKRRRYPPRKMPAAAVIFVSAVFYASRIIRVRGAGQIAYLFVIAASYIFVRNDNGKRSARGKTVFYAA